MNICTYVPYYHHYNPTIFHVILIRSLSDNLRHHILYIPSVFPLHSHRMPDKKIYYMYVYMIDIINEINFINVTI